MRVLWVWLLGLVARVLSGAATRAQRLSARARERAEAARVHRRRGWQHDVQAHLESGPPADWLAKVAAASGPWLDHSTPIDAPHAAAAEPRTGEPAPGAGTTPQAAVPQSTRALRVPFRQRRGSQAPTQPRRPVPPASEPEREDEPGGAV